MVPPRSEATTLGTGAHSRNSKCQLPMPVPYFGRCPPLAVCRVRVLPAPDTYCERVTVVRLALCAALRRRVPPSSFSTWTPRRDRGTSRS